MNRNAASLVLIVRSTVDRVRRGESPFAGALEEECMTAVSESFAREIIHDGFYEGVEALFTRGEDPRLFMNSYMAAVFAQGFSAGARFTEGTQ